MKASNTEEFDQFGTSVAVSGDTVVVGAVREASNATGVNGNQSDNSAPLAGAAYVFVRDGTTWSQQAYLKASNTDADDFFGFSVAVSADTVVVGALLEDSNATGVNGNQSDNSAFSAGAAYVFVRNGTTWSQQAYLKASNTDANDFFGISVAVSADTVVVGARREDSNATGINGNQSNDSAEDAGATYVFTGLPTPTQLGNISTRAFVQTGDNVEIGGFIVQGTEPKRVIIRAIGPELGAPPYNVPNALANPTLELHNGTEALIASNNDWATTIIGGIITANQVRDIQASGYAPGDGLESAIIADLSPGNYTAIVRGVNNMTGVGLVEVYDLSPDASSILANISTRAFVQTGDNVMIGGFIVQGTTTKRVIIRAIGPELGAPPFNVPNALANPTLELHDATRALIGSNDNWQHTIIGGIITADQVSAIQSSGKAPGNASESAIIATLPPGNYTAIVRGVDNTTGVALVEVYDLDR